MPGRDYGGGGDSSSGMGMGMGLGPGVYDDSHVNAILLETGEYLLLETGDAMLKE